MCLDVFFINCHFHTILRVLISNYSESSIEDFEDFEEFDHIFNVCLCTCQSSQRGRCGCMALICLNKHEAVAAKGNRALDGET
jgi:hypothetical protein